MNESEMNAEAASRLAGMLLIVQEEIVQYVTDKMLALGGDKVQIPCVDTPKSMAIKFICKTVQTHYVILVESINRAITTAEGGYWVNDREADRHEHWACQMVNIEDHFRSKCVELIDKEFKQIEQLNRCLVRNEDGTFKRDAKGQLIVRNDV